MLCGELDYVIAKQKIGGYKGISALIFKALAKAKLA